MIEIKDLKKTFGKVKAVNGLTFNINDGEIFALLGLNGAGKSTTIKILCTLLLKDSGSVIIDGLDIDKDRKKIKSIISLSPQETAVAANLTVYENLKFIADLYGINVKNKNGKNCDDKIEEIIKKFTLTAKRNAKAKTLSGGQKRRLSLAMAFITEPKFLILDEPTLGLDVKVRRDLWRLIKEYSAYSTVIITTHYLEEAEQLANRIGIMKDGELVALGTAKQIIEKVGASNFEEAFLRLAGEEDE